MRRTTQLLGRIAVALAVLLVTAPARPSSLRPVNLPEMVKKAERIFIGTAVNEWTGRDRHGIPATVTTFEVSRVLKGAPGERLQVKQFGVTEVQPDGLAAWIDGMPRYRRGGEYLIFLNRDSQFGFTSPVGAFQGAFQIRAAGEGRKAAVNGINNANLVRGLDREAKSQLGLLPERFPFVSRSRGPIHLVELTAMVERLHGLGKGVSR